MQENLALPTGVSEASLIDGRYRVLTELGRGAMGVVYLARDEGLDREVAVKVVPPSLSSHECVVAQLRAEARALAAVSHPHVVAVHALGEENRSSYFVMEHVRGNNLRARLNAPDGDALGVNATLTLVESILAGLAEVHAAGLVHRDIKPENIVIEERTQRPVLVDFGLADEREALGGAAGTPTYCPAEQLIGEPVAPHFDTYAIGVLLYELFSGAPPFEAESLSMLIQLHATAPRPRLSAIDSALAPFDSFIARALHKKPARRYATAAEMLRGLVAARAAFADEQRSVDVALRTDTTSVLIVESDAEVGNGILRAAETAFFWSPVDVASVDSCRKGTSEIDRRRPDVLVVGPSILGVQAVDLVRELRARPRGQRVRVVAWREEHEPREVRAELTSLGVDYILSPIDIRIICEVLRTFTQRQRVSWGKRTEPASPISWAQDGTRVSQMRERVSFAV